MRRWVYMLILAVALVGLVAGVAVWRAAASPHYYSTTVELSAIAYPDPGHAWAAGNTWADDGLGITGGTVHVTTNGGASWQDQKSAMDWSDPSGITFANATCGWLVGSAQPIGDVLPSDENTVLATTDGGATWQRQLCRTDKYLFTGIACASVSDAWLVGGDMNSNGAVFATRDGGATWIQQATTEAGDLWGIAFADARHGFAVGDGVILATADGGASWSEHPVKGTFLRAVACGDASSAWAVGSDSSDRDVILATSDGGASWRVQYSGDGPDSTGQVGYSGVAFTDAANGWVVGLGGMILATMDGGRTWQSQHSGTKLDLNGVAFADDKHGVVVGAEIEGDDPLAGRLDGSIILRTEDGGATWQQ